MIYNDFLLLFDYYYYYYDDDDADELFLWCG